MQNNNIEEFLSFLLKFKNVEIIEAVIDTTVSKNYTDDEYSMIPYLNLYALNTFSDYSVGAVLEIIESSQQWFALGDYCEEVGSCAFEISLSHFYPNWPNDSEECDKRLIATLSTAYKEAAVQSRFLFHHIDAWPPLLVV